MFFGCFVSVLLGFYQKHRRSLLANHDIYVVPHFDFVYVVDLFVVILFM